MTSQELRQARERANITQSKLAAALGVTPRTIAGWESSDPPRDLSFAESRAVADLLIPCILEPILTDMTELAFKAVPSELVAIWIVRGTDCILLPRAVRRHDLATQERIDALSPWVNAPMVSESLTVYPLKSGRTENLAGDGILRHPAKKYPTRAAQHFARGMCESLLHVPAFIPSPRGPHPVLMLSLENKLSEDRSRVILAEKDEPIYTAADVKKASELSDQFLTDLAPDMRLLQILD